MKKEAEKWCEYCSKLYGNNLKLFLKDSKDDLNHLVKYRSNEKVFKQYEKNVRGNFLYLQKMLAEKQAEIFFLKKQLNEVDLNNQMIAGKIKPQRKPISASLRHEVFVKDGFKCTDCGATNKERTLHVDHIIPVSQGGGDELSNLQTLCDKCNLAKSNRAWLGGTGIPVEQPIKTPHKSIDYRKLAEESGKRLEIKREILKLIKLKRLVRTAKIIKC